MQPLFAILIVAAVLVLVLWLILWQRRRERSRAEALHHASQAMGFRYEPKVEVDQLKSLAQLPIYDRGRSPRARNVMTGRVNEDEVTVLDFQYTTGGGEHQRHVSQTLAVFRGEVRHLPEMQIAPENVLHRIGQRFGYQDIDFESNPDFSKRFLVRGPDDTAIRASLQPGVLTYLATLEGLTIEVRAGAVAIYRAGKRRAPDEIRAFVEEAHGVFRHLRRR